MQTIEEQKRLVAYLLHPTDSCKFGLLLALYTGLRIGELCALRWSCIDLREQTIRIAATMQRLGGTGEGTRIVINAPRAIPSLGRSRFRRRSRCCAGICSLRTRRPMS